jgi:3-hydroxyisobutyrate dehydrogenase-like beta-hydroxyacid dehydrogenase
MKSLAPDQVKLGFIGLGSMGSRIATLAGSRISTRSVLKAGKSFVSRN